MTAPAPRPETAARAPGPGAEHRRAAGPARLDPAVLGWVLGDLEAELGRARGAIEAYAGGERTPELIGAGADALRRSRNVLEMLEAYGLALALGEMSLAVAALAAAEDADLEEFGETVLGALLRLSEHLHALGDGRSEGALELLPVLNDLRSLRGAPLLSESVLFNPDLDAPLPATAPPALVGEERLRTYARQLRAHYQRGVLGWHRGRPESQGLAIVAAVVAHLEKLAAGTASARLWWVAAALVEALRHGGLAAEAAVRHVFLELDAVLKRLVAEGSAAFEPLPRELLKNLLFYVARATSDGERVRAAREAFALDAPEPGSRAGDLGARRTVAAAVRDELAEVKEVLDAAARSGADPAGLATAGRRLERLADALALLDLGRSQKRLLSLASAIGSSTASGRLPSEGELMDIAAGVLGVESALASVAEAGERRDPLAALEEGTGATMLTATEWRRLAATVIREAGTELAAIKQTVAERVAERRPADARAAVGERVRRVAGAMRMLGLETPAALLARWGAAAITLLSASSRSWEPGIRDALGDGLEALHLELEAAAGAAPTDPGRIGLAEAAVDRLEAGVADLASRAPVVEAAEEPPPAAPTRLLPKDVDETILGIFVEEADEAVHTLGEHLTRWLDNPDDREALVIVRRAFHTLKGSGRMVGARELGELAWIVEDLLNRVIDGLCPPAPAVLELVADAHGRLPAVIDDFRAGRPSDLDLAGLARRAERALSVGGVAGADEPEAALPASGAPGLGREAAAPGAAVAMEAARPRPELESDQATSDEGPDLDDPHQVFQVEAAEILDLVDDLLRHWREDPGDRGCITALQRELHTLKGGARICNLGPMGDLAHQMESILVLVAEGRLAPDENLVELAERCHDRLSEMLERVRACAPLDPAHDLAERLESVASLGEARTAAAVTAASGLAPAASSPDDRPRPRLGERPSVVLGRGDRVQVPAAFLDRLASYAGELSVAQSRMGQQVGTFRHSLEEMEQTILRLRERLRRLELEAETDAEAPPPPGPRGGDERGPAQAAGVVGDAGFDPLEMERYSRVQELSRGLAECVSDLESIRGLLDGIARESDAILSEQARVSRDLHQGLMRTRMLSISGLVHRFRRLVRRTMSELGKQVDLRVEGGDVQLDRAVLDLLTPALEHMLRNAVDHGIETPGERRAAGKPEVGLVTLSFARAGAEMEIRVADDGRGLDLHELRRIAERRGLLPEVGAHDDEAVVRCILEPGFSTAREVTQISGRGVGLDVVNADVKQLGGRLSIESRAGAGCEFVIRVPFTLALNHAMLVGVGEETVALPLASVDAVVRVPCVDLEALARNPSPVFEHGAVRYPLVDLASLLGFPPATEREDDGSCPLVLVRSGSERVALAVDAVGGRQEVVVKPLVAPFAGLPMVSGATVLGDGRVALILDVTSVVSRGLRAHERATCRPARVSPAAAPPARPTVLVVDDSITVRQVTKRLLERHGMQVLTAKDGIEALERARARRPDLMLLDIEMPRMDGLTLAREARADPGLAGVPIIMITSRTGPKHSELARQAGVARYLGKPYQEQDLLAHIEALLGEAEHRDG